MRITVVILAMLAVAPSFYAAATWRPVQSDLPPDPALQRGTLENGLQYAVMRHPYPVDRVSVRLLVASGSRDEKNEERGIAHFVEHLAFRGTRNYPRGSLTTELQKIGISYGPDSSAFTSYDNTIYHLELPDRKPETLAFALRVIRDFADGITFEPEAIPSERTVIVNEMSIRNTSSSREALANQTFLWPTSREVRRSPIGLLENYNRFNREALTAFYDAWYRPERMAVIITGDIEAEQAVAMIRDSFSSLTARAPRPDEPVGLVPAEANPQFVDVFRDAAINGVLVVLEHPFSSPSLPDTRTERQRNLARALALSMFQARLQRVAAQQPALSSSSTGFGAGVAGWTVVNFSGSSSVDNWRTAVEAMEKELRRAREFGFTETELAQAKSRYVAYYEDGVRTADTRPAAALASSLADMLLYGIQFSTPRTVTDEMKALIAAASVESCSRAFQEAWGEGRPHIFIGANPALTIAPDEIARAFDESRAVAVERPTEIKAGAFAYEDFGAAGALRRQGKIPDLEVEFGEFENGVRLNFRRTPYDQGSVGISVRVGYGQQIAPAGGIGLLAEYGFLEGGLGKHSSEDLGAIFAGRSFSVSFGVNDDALVFRGRSSREELEFTLKVIAAYVADPGFRPDAMRQAQIAGSTLYSQLANQPGGEISGQLERVLTGGDARFGIASPAEFSARTLAELAAWLQPQLKSGPVEIAVAGDTTWEAVSTAVGRTLGALPRRDPRSVSTARQIRIVPVLPLQVYTGGANVRQGSMTVVFPAGEVIGAEQERRCYMLAAVLDELIRIGLRDELGATYTPSVSFVRHHGLEGLSYFSISADVLPEHLSRILPIVYAAARTIHFDGIREDVFKRIHQTVIRSIEDGTRTNSYWLDAVLGKMQQYPERIDAARTMTRDFAAITAAELQQLAIRFLQPREAFTFLSAPPGIEVRTQ